MAVKDLNDLNDRWRNTVIKLDDDNEGTRVAAANALHNMIRSQGVKLHDFELVKKNGAARRPPSRSAKSDREHLALIEENLRLRTLLVDAKIANASLELKTHDQQETIREFREEIEQLRQDNFRLDNGTATQIADLRRTLAERDAEIARLKANAKGHTYEAPAEDRAETQVEEEDDMAKRDPWQTLIARFLRQHRVDRISTYELLKDAVGLPAAEQTTDVGRRVSRIMTAIGGWRPSTNINLEGTIMRGYIKVKPDVELERLKTKHVGPHGEWRPPSAKRK